jgi:hypothetical protein
MCIESLQFCTLNRSSSTTPITHLNFLYQRNTTLLSSLNRFSHFFPSPVSLSGVFHIPPSFITPRLVLATFEVFTELLTFRQTRDGKLTSTFNFTIDLPQEAFPTAEFASYTLLPSSLGEILRKDGVTEIHMTLNSGKWDYLKWGYEALHDPTSI